MKNKKILFIITIGILLVIVISVIYFFRVDNSYEISITIPAGSMESYVYSDEEIMTKKKQITITTGKNLGDTEVKLLPVEMNEERVYESTYLTTGIPVKMNVESYAWFKIGVNIQNPTDQDMVVSVNVSGIEVRIE